MVSRAHLASKVIICVIGEEILTEVVFTPHSFPVWKVGSGAGGVFSKSESFLLVSCVAMVALSNSFEFSVYWNCEPRKCLHRVNLGV